MEKTPRDMEDQGEDAALSQAASPEGPEHAPRLSIAACLISDLCGPDGATSSSFSLHKRSISLDSKGAFF